MSNTDITKAYPNLERYKTNTAILQALTQQLSGGLTPVKDVTAGNYVTIQVFIAKHLWDSKPYLGCANCGSKTKDESADEGDPIICDSNRCKGNNSRLVPIHFESFFGGDETGAFVLSFSSLNRPKGDLIGKVLKIRGTISKKQPQKPYKMGDNEYQQFSAYKAEVVDDVPEEQPQITDEPVVDESESPTPSPTPSDPLRIKVRTYLSIRKTPTKAAFNEWAVRQGTTADEVFSKYKDMLQYNPDGTIALVN